MQFAKASETHLPIGDGWPASARRQNTPGGGLTAKAQGSPTCRRTLGQDARHGRTLKEFHSLQLSARSESGRLETARPQFKWLTQIASNGWNSFRVRLRSGW